MNNAIQLLLFAFGTFVGSFVNVLGSRYSEKKGFKLAVHGRSKCDHCGKPLKWHELVPILSFIILSGKCSSCKTKIPARYTVVEILAGLVLAFVPEKLGQGIPTMIWVLAFLVFILISIIDLRLKIIPDKLTIFLAILGVLLITYYKSTGTFGLVDGNVNGSFLGAYAVSFWLGGPSVFINYGLGVAFSLIFFGLIYFLGKGRAMGLGDVKLAGAVGLLLGWPDISAALILSFITGAVYGLVLISKGRKNMKDTIPFGPFIILGVTLVFFFGYYIVNGYFSFFQIY